MLLLFIYIYTVIPPTFSSHSVSESSHLHREIQQTGTWQVSCLKVIFHVSYASKYPRDLAVCDTETPISVAQKGVNRCVGPDISVSLDSLRLVPLSKTEPWPNRNDPSYLGYIPDTRNNCSKQTPLTKTITNTMVCLKTQFTTRHDTFIGTKRGHDSISKVDC